MAKKLFDTIKLREDLEFHSKDLPKIEESLDKYEKPIKHYKSHTYGNWAGLFVTLEEEFNFFFNGHHYLNENYMLQREGDYRRGTSDLLIVPKEKGKTKPPYNARKDNPVVVIEVGSLTRLRKLSASYDIEFWWVSPALKYTQDSKANTYDRLSQGPIAKSRRKEDKLWIIRSKDLENKFYMSKQEESIE